jgi:hypothetical protein
MMAETAKSAGQRAATAKAAGRSTAEAEQTERTGNGEARREPTATLDLPLVTMQFRAPHLHVPGRGDVEAVARGARSWLPEPKAALYFGALAVTAALGVIEWPVAAAIGVGMALASRGEANPQPSGSAGTGQEESSERAEARA